MPLSPSPLLPGTSPLPVPGRRPPDRRALRLAALLVMPVLLVSLVGGQFLLPRVLFLAPGLQAVAGSGNPVSAGGSTFQGFVYPWTKRMRGGGYTTPASLKNMQSQASVFHMNAVIIPVVAGMRHRSESAIDWTAGKSVDTLPDANYIQAIQDARKAGLVPILELVVKQQDKELSSTAPGKIDESSQLIGVGWSPFPSTQSINLSNGSSRAVGQLEKGWFDNYTNFAVYFAQISQQYHLPYFIIGNQLSNVTSDNDRTSAKNDPKGIDRGVPGESFPDCKGRRDCEWRHVIHAIHAPTFATYNGHKSHDGGGYSGKLIYAASAVGAKEGATDTEFEQITWWDAVDFIGVDAFFPLTQNADVSIDRLSDAWHGKGVDLKNPQKQKDIVSRLGKVSSTYDRSILFTAAGYESTLGANGNPSHTTGSSQATPDNSEQLNDVQALYGVFSQEDWWAGVFWYADYPISPRTSQSNWETSSAWAGDSLATSKPAGKWLAAVYQRNPLPCSC
jgi:hypothetical protein